MLSSVLLLSLPARLRSAVCTSGRISSCRIRRAFCVSTPHSAWIPFARTRGSPSAKAISTRWLRWPARAHSTPPPAPLRLAGVLGHSNSLMPYLNLCAPLALLALLQTRRPAGRVLLASWLVFYLVVLPFSSSRGGWLGFAAWLGILVLYWAWQRGLSGVYTLLWAKRSIRFRLAEAAIMLLALAGAVGAWQYFSSHASHGSGGGLFSSRSEIWNTALAIYQSSPWLGSGPGRFPYEYLVWNKGVPPAFWALHAHSLPVEFLSEFGLFGLAALAAVILVGAWRLFKRFRLVEPGRPRWWAVAAAAAIASLGIHSVVEDPTRVVPAMLVLVVLLGIIATRPVVPLARWKVGLWVLCLPALLLLGLEGWMTWAYQPMSGGMAAAQQNRWVEASKLVSE